MKKIFKYILVSLMPIYLIVTLALYAPETGNIKCTRVHIELVDSLETHFTSVKEIQREIMDKGINPIGKLYSRINTEKMENVLKKKSTYCLCRMLQNSMRHCTYKTDPTDTHTQSHK